MANQPRKQAGRKGRSSREFEKALEAYSRGELSGSRFRTYYQSLRAIVNSRMDRMEEAGLDSTALDSAEFFNDRLYGTDRFGAYSKQEDAVDTFIKMLEFMKSPWSTKRGYQEASRVYDDFVKALERGNVYNVPQKEEFLRFVANGDFARLVNALGNSPDAIEEAEAAFNAGVTAEEFAAELDLYIESSQSGANAYYGYNKLVERAKQRAKEREEMYEKARNRRND